MVESSVHGLNLSVPEDAKEVIKPWDQREETSKYAESGVDDQVHIIFVYSVDVILTLEQIIIHVPFSQNVRLKSVLLKLGRQLSCNSILMLTLNSLQVEAKLRHNTFAYMPTTPILSISQKQSLLNRSLTSVY